MTESNEMATKINAKELALLKKFREKGPTGCLQESDKIVIHRDNQNYTLTYGELLDHLQSFLGTPGDARILFTNQYEPINLYKPSKLGPTEIAINDSEVTFEDEDKNIFGVISLNNIKDKTITIPRVTLKSPGGKRFYLTVSDDGTLGTEEIS